MELCEVPYETDTNQNFEPSSKRELSKSPYMNRAPSNEELNKGYIMCVECVVLPWLLNYLMLAYVRLAYLRLAYLHVRLAYLRLIYAQL